MTYVRHNLLPLVIAALVAAVLAIAVTHRTTESTTTGHAPVCSIDGNFDNDLPGCVSPVRTH